MNDRLMEYLVDPVRSRILMEVHAAGRVTVSRLCERCPSIPRSTMYRHLARMEKEGLVQVVETRRIRGTTEKTFALVESAFVLTEGQDDGAIGRDRVMSMFAEYMMRLFSEFRENLPEVVDKDTMMGFTTAPVYVTDEELKRFMESVGRMVEALMANEATPDRKPHSIGFIVTPPRS